MNSQFVADWSSNMGDAFAPLGGEDDGLIKLLWCNGHVVMQSQAPPRKPPSRPEKASAPAMQEDEAVATWFQYPVVDDGESLEKDIFSEIFGEMAPAHAGRTCMEEERGAAVTKLQSGVMPPSPRPEKAGWGNEVGDNYARGASEGVVAAMDAGESSSVLTIGSRRVCGSNHVQVPCVVVSDTTAGDSAPPPPIRDGTSSIPARSSHHDPSTTVTTSSSMRSRPPGAASRKRKQSGSMDQPESLSEDVEYESAAATREPAQKLTTAKRRRAAEVHNLSERRRRDRINEKMKSLQELIPHCNKTDKASMLDEAIEYLKSLQRQVQMMWMDGDMAAVAATPAPVMWPPPPVMFPAGVHQYMQRMASMPRMPPFMPAAQSFPAVSHLPAADSYPRCLAVEHLQPPPSAMHYMQGMMRFYQLGAAKNPQQNTAPPPPPVVPGGSLPATAVAPPPDNALHRNYENCSMPGMKGVAG